MEYGIRATSTGGGNIGISVSSVGGDGSIQLGTGIQSETSGQTTIDLTGQVYGRTAAVHVGGGGGVTVNIDNTAVVNDPRQQQQYALLIGNLNLLQAGAAELNVGDTGSWVFGRSNRFGAGDDVVNVAIGGRVYNQCGGLSFGSCNGGPNISPAIGGDEAALSLDFGPGNDRFVNAGTLQVGTRYYQNNLAGGAPRQSDIQELAATLRLENLEHFDNAGSIVLGTVFSNDTVLQIDGWNDDILSMPGTAFSGSGNSRILFDVNFNGSGQTACDGTLRDANGWMPAADCVDLRGGSTAGSTEIVIATDIIRGDFGAYTPDGVVLVDVNGGTSAAEHFTLSPDSVNYNPELGAIEKRAFVYALGYDEANQQHKLYGMPGQDLYQMPLMAHAAQALWRGTATSWFDRQSDVRLALREGAALEGGAWVRVGSGSADRTVAQSVTGGTTTLSFDNSYEQETTTLNLGVDFLVGKEGDRAWSVGGMIGYGSSDLRFDHRANRANFEGPTLGAYASWLQGDWFVDAVLAGNWMSFDFDVPTFDLFPDSAILVTDTQTVGLQVDAGWRWQSGRYGVEPLLGLSYVQASFDDMDIPADDSESTGGASVAYDTATSLRASLGVHLSARDLLPRLFPLALNLTARAVNETDGEARVAIGNTGPVAAPVANTFDGTFIEMSGGVTLSNAKGNALGYLNIDSTFNSDYESLGFSAGFRYRW